MPQLSVSATVNVVSRRIGRQRLRFEETRQRSGFIAENVADSSLLNT
jgi:hypothetical protein